MNYIDILLIMIILLNAAQGWNRGFLRALFALISWVGSFALALRFYQPVADWLAPRVSWPEIWIRPAAFMLTATLAATLLSLVGSLIFRRVSRDAERSATSRALGLVPGLVSGVISATLLATALLIFPVAGDFGETARQSKLANQLGIYSDRVEAALSPVFGDAIAQTLQMLTIKPGSDELVELPFTLEGAEPRPDLEEEMLALINKERAEAGLEPLEADPELTEVARAHSGDMLARGYFSHNTPEGKDPFERIGEAGVRYTTAGENLALAPTLTLAHTGLMESPGHRENILRESFGRVGIGILDAGPRGVMVTQNFRN